MSYHFDFMGARTQLQEWAEGVDRQLATLKGRVAKLEARDNEKPKLSDREARLVEAARLVIRDWMLSDQCQSVAIEAINKALDAYEVKP